MEHTVSNRRARSTRSILVFGLSAILLLAFTSPVSATGDDGGGVETVVVSGDSVPSDCNEGQGAGSILLTGDVDGCLTFFPESFTCDELNGFDRYREFGTEEFVGSLHGESGEFRTTYELEASYASGFCDAVDAGGFPFELQLTGGCDHTVIGESGAFAGVSGLITFFDVIPEPGVSGASNFLYAGDLEIPAAESLTYGTHADRSAGASLDGATVAGDVYVWLSPLHPHDVDSIRWVDFSVNGELLRREWQAPYDMSGGGDAAATGSWNTSGVPNGEVTVTATVGLKDGSTRDVSATFQVAN